MDPDYTASTEKATRALVVEKNRTSNKLDRKTKMQHEELMTVCYDRFAEKAEGLGLPGIPQRLFFFDSNGRIPFYRDVDEMADTLADIEKYYSVGERDVHDSRQETKAMLRGINGSIRELSKTDD